MYLLFIHTHIIKQNHAGVVHTPQDIAVFHEWNVYDFYQFVTDSKLFQFLAFFGRKNT